MEEKLKRYRLQTQRIQYYINLKRKFKNMIFGHNGSSVENEDQSINIDEMKSESETETIKAEATDKLVMGSDIILKDTINNTTKTIDYITYFVYFLIWVTFYAISIELKFGIVYFMLSILGGIYLNTRTGTRPENELSAYSVFNPNVMSIQGTLKAEQFEREIGMRHIS
uniref:CSON002258 protein n=1 Tax=Culicoides sonorensis TaxID=179676 RepID=A0A336K5R9_CULSO